MLLAGNATGCHWAVLQSVRHHLFFPTSASSTLLGLKPYPATMTATWSIYVLPFLDQKNVSSGPSVRPMCPCPVLGSIFFFKALKFHHIPWDHDFRKEFVNSEYVLVSIVYWQTSVHSISAWENFTHNMILLFVPSYVASLIIINRHLIVQIRLFIHCVYSQPFCIWLRFVKRITLP